jgi:hypothetical protein
MLTSKTTPAAANVNLGRIDTPRKKGIRQSIDAFANEIDYKN